jgi:hypothetical protein
MEDKLLFILYSVKVYPLQEMLACEFCMVQSTAHEWIHILSAGLKKAWDDGGHLPERSPKALAAVLPAASSAVYGIDGPERRRQRPSDPDQQEDYDSGKKKHRRSSISLWGTSRRVKRIT